MRAIKFRAWDPIKKAMEPVTCLFFLDGGRVEVAHHLRDMVFMQFTGLLDGNSKEIYEGDAR